MVLRAGNLLRMTAVNDSFAGRIIMHQIRFMGTGLTPGDRLSIVNSYGAVVTEHFVTNPIEDVNLLGASVRFGSNGLAISAMPAGNVEVQFHLL